MFDWYEPVPALACPMCGERVEGWQGKEGESDQWLWRQGNAAPVEHCVDPEWRKEARGQRLPARFWIHASCPRRHRLEAIGEAPDGTWTTTTMVTPPVRPTQDASGLWSCPCCGSFTVPDEPPGTHSVCSVCRWEDDRAQYEDPDLAGRSNERCLRHARREHVLAALDIIR